LLAFYTVKVGFLSANSIIFPFDFHRFSLTFSLQLRFRKK
jgi:hypothetical protein